MQIQSTHKMDTGITPSLQLVTLGFTRPIKVFNDEDMVKLPLLREIVIKATRQGQFVDMTLGRHGNKLFWSISLPMSQNIPNEILSAAELNNYQICEPKINTTRYCLSNHNQRNSRNAVSSLFELPWEQLVNVANGDFQIWITCGGHSFYYQNITPVSITASHLGVAEQLAQWLGVKTYEYNPATVYSLPTLDFRNQEIGFIFRPPFICTTLGYMHWATTQLKDIMVSLKQSPQFLMRNGGIFGSPGAGKTKTAKKVLETIVQLIKTCLIVDVKSEYQDLQHQGFEIISVGNSGMRDLRKLKFNPFIPAIQTRLDTHVFYLAELIAFSLFGGGGSLVSSYLYMLLKEFFAFSLSNSTTEKLRAKVEGNHYLPNLFQSKGIELRKRFSEGTLQGLTPDRLIKFWQINKDTFAKKIFNQGQGRGKEDVLDVISARLNILETSFLQFFDYQSTQGIEMLEDRKIVLQLGGANDAEIKGLMSIVSLFFVNHLLSQPDSDGQLKGLLVIEEAHVIAERSTNNNGEFRSGSQVIGEALARGLSELRSRGIGFLIIDQSPHRLLPEVIANTAIQIVHNLQFTADQQLIGQSMGVEPQRLSTLSVGEAMVKIAGESPFSQRIRL